MNYQIILNLTNTTEIQQTVIIGLLVQCNIKYERYEDQLICFTSDLNQLRLIKNLHRNINQNTIRFQDNFNEIYEFNYDTQLKKRIA